MRERKRGTPKNNFTAAGLSSMKTVANRHICAAIIRSTDNKLLRGVNINDLE